MLDETAATVEIDAAGNGAAFKVEKNSSLAFSEIDGRVLIPGMNRHLRPETITQILDDVRSSAPASNWPWNYYLTSNGQQHAIRNALAATMNSSMVAQRNRYKHFNRKWRAPHHGNISIGDPLYQRFEELKPDKQRLLKAYYRCMRLLHAPIFLFFTVGRYPVERSWLEYGGFLNKTMAGAADLGLVAETAGFAPFHDVIREILQWGKTETPICGMSMHHASTAAIDEIWPLSRTKPTWPWHSF